MGVDTEQKKIVRIRFIRKTEKFDKGDIVDLPFHQAHEYYTYGFATPTEEKTLTEKVEATHKRELEIEEKESFIIEEGKKGNYKEDNLNLFLENKEEIAEEFYNSKPYFYDGIGLFWFWDKENLKYAKKDIIALMVELKELANNKNFSIIGQKFWTETIRALKLIGRDKEPKPFNKDCIQFGKWIYNYKTNEKTAATPEYFNVNPIPYELGKSKETPVIDSIFAEWVGEKYVKTLKETIALGTIQDYPLHRIIYLFGSGLNGKGCFMRLLNIFFGRDNVCSTTLTRILKSNFESAKLYKKLICLMGETEFTTLTDTSTIKQLTGQDLISGEFKGINGFDFENYALMFMGSNSLPMTLDKTKGFYRRPMIIDFPNEFKEGIDVLEKIPPEEYNNLCNQILELLPELIKRGRFDKDGDIEERKKRYEEKSNPMGLFIKESFVQNVNGEVPFFEFYDGFEFFCKDRGFREMTKKNVSLQLNNMGYETEKKDVKREDGSWTKWTYVLGLQSQNKVKETNSTLSTQSTQGSIPFSTHENQYDPQVERVEEVEIIEDTLKFDQNLVQYVKCSIENCAEYQTNPDSEGRAFCKDHWEGYAKK